MVLGLPALSPTYMYFEFFFIHIHDLITDEVMTHLLLILSPVSNFVAFTIGVRFHNFNMPGMV